MSKFDALAVLLLLVYAGVIGYFLWLDHKTEEWERRDRTENELGLWLENDLNDR